jgi:hypothetical protein
MPQGDFEKLSRGEYMALKKLNRKQLSLAVARETYEAGQRMKQEAGKGVMEILLEIIYKEDASSLARVQAIRVFYEVISTFLEDDDVQEILEAVDVYGLREH